MQQDSFHNIQRLQVFKKPDSDADELMGLSSAKRGGKKTKKGAEKAADKPVRLSWKRCQNSAFRATILQTLQ